MSFVEFENRRAKSARILVILLLEDENGSPLDRIEIATFKLASGRLKEKNETVKLSGRESQSRPDGSISSSKSIE